MLVIAVMLIECRQFPRSPSFDRRSWQQTFDSAEHYQGIAHFIATANEQNLDRLTAEVLRGQSADQRVD